MLMLMLAAVHSYLCRVYVTHFIGCYFHYAHTAIIIIAIITMKNEMFYCWLHRMEENLIASDPYSLTPKATLTLTYTRTRERNESKKSKPNNLRTLAHPLTYILNHKFAGYHILKHLSRTFGAVYWIMCRVHVMLVD